jgi:hypothetical protein
MKPMNDQTARWIGIILAIVASTVINRILNDKKIQDLEAKLIVYIEAQLVLMGVPQSEAKPMIDAIKKGEAPPTTQPEQ